MIIQSIWKYPIPIEDCFSLELPEGAVVLCVQLQHGQPCIWAKVNPHPHCPTEKRKFFIHGTGHELNHAAKRYVGTFQMNGGALVFHLFEPEYT